MKYRIKEYTPCHWHVIAENGHPVYDDARDGNDTPLIFTCEDIAISCAERLTKESESNAAFELASYVEKMVEDGMPEETTELKKLLADFWKEYYRK